MSDYRVGDRVIVRINPHLPEVEYVNVLAVVTRVGPVVCGQTLYYCSAVGWPEPLPLNAACLDPGDPEHLEGLAAEYEAKAAELRRLAAQGRPTRVKAGRWEPSPNWQHSPVVRDSE
jgi:hypothetical protein